jgi:hypothetical protein
MYVCMYVCVCVCARQLQLIIGGAPDRKLGGASELPVTRGDSTITF